jgi:hypothetical protein
LPLNIDVRQPQPQVVMMRGWIIVALVVALSGPATAQQPSTQAGGALRSDVPAIVTRGLDAYRTGGLGAAADVWLVGSPVAGASARAQLVGGLAPLEAAYGNMIGSDVVDVVAIGAHVRRVYVVIRLERGPLYAFFECYQEADGGWIIPAFLLNAKATDIFPAHYLGG